VSADLHIIANVLVAFGLTFALGFERAIRGSSAGDRTFSLIGVGTSIIGVLSAQGAPTILTGAVTGVGFIGAGLLFRQTDANVPTVHGVTTAAAILAASAIGAVAGSGKLVLATVATLLVVLSLEVPYIPGLRWLDARRWADNFKSDTDPHHGAPPAGFLVTPEPTATHEPPNAHSHALGGAGVHLGATVGTGPAAAVGLIVPGPRVESAGTATPQAAAQLATAQAANDAAVEEEATETPGE
jgi:putative Mg2+ transporter-C (MgtC) family protein